MRQPLRWSDLINLPCIESLVDSPDDQMRLKLAREGTRAGSEGKMNRRERSHRIGLRERVMSSVRSNAVVHSRDNTEFESSGDKKRQTMRISAWMPSVVRRICWIGLLAIEIVYSSIGAFADGRAELFPAFPGAEGAGAYTPGGRGGQVLTVTNLDDYDPREQKPIPGSLRRAVMTRGPRIILFHVSGTIELKRDLTISEPFITIAE